MQISNLNSDLCLFCSNLLDGGKQRLQQRLFSPTLTIALNCGFARGRPLRMIICKRPVPPNDHLKEACPSRWLFARGWPIRMIICNLQDASPSRWSFAFVVCHCLLLFAVCHLACPLQPSRIDLFSQFLPFFCLELLPIISQLKPGRAVVKAGPPT